MDKMQRPITIQFMVLFICPIEIEKICEHKSGCINTSINIHIELWYILIYTVSVLSVKMFTSLFAKNFKIQGQNTSN